jgi:hypothetical protein
LLIMNLWSFFGFMRAFVLGRVKHITM